MMSPMTSLVWSCAGTEAVLNMKPSQIDYAQSSSHLGSLPLSVHIAIILSLLMCAQHVHGSTLLSSHSQGSKTDVPSSHSLCRHKQWTDFSIQAAG